MNQSPILRALSSMRKNGVRTLLTGGQACVFYGAAEFSRDLDLLILADPASLERLHAALADLEAEPIAGPFLSAAHLMRGHAVHFRCRRNDVAGLRVGLMSRYRAGPGFEDLWNRRTTIAVSGDAINLPLTLEDLAREAPVSAVQIESAVAAALTQSRDAVTIALAEEEREERRRDREYWLPLKLELEQFRFERRNQKL